MFCMCHSNIAGDMIDLGQSYDKKFLMKMVNVLDLNLREGTCIMQTKTKNVQDSIKTIRIYDILSSNFL